MSEFKQQYMINFDLRTSYFWVVFLSILLSICFPLHKSSDSHSLPYQLSRAQSQLTNGFEVQTSPEVQRSLSCISHSASFSPLEYCNTFLTSLFFAVRTYIQDGLCAARPFASHSSVLLPLLNFSSCISPPFNCSHSHLQRRFDLLAARRGWNTSNVAPSWCNSLPHMAQAIGGKVKTWKKEGVAAL